MSSRPQGCLAVRTYFGDDAAWQRLKAAARQPDAYSGYIASVRFVDDPAWVGLSPDDLRAQTPDDPDGAMVSFLADERAQRDEGRVIGKTAQVRGVSDRLTLFGRDCPADATV